MDPNYDYSFTASVSVRPFHDKESAKVGSEGLRFHRQMLDTDVFLYLAGKGYAFCYNHKGDRRLMENFQDTSIIIFDIDYPEMEMKTYIQRLPYKPTMAYTTYSNDPGINHFRFRLVYCFDDSITKGNEFYSLYWAVSAANGFGNSLDNRKINQLYYGSDDRLDGFQDYNSHIVYSFDDFKEYLPGPGEASIIPDNTVSLARPLLTYNDGKNDTLQDKDIAEYYNNYVRSLESPLILSQSLTHYTFPEEYYAVPIRLITQDGKRVVKRWADGEQRRRRLYISALIMLRNVPELTPDNLSFNLWQLMSEYYDNQKDPIGKDDIDGIVERAFERRDTYDLKPSKHKGVFRVNKTYWAERGISARQAVPIVLKERHQTIMDFYDPSLSVSANYDALLEMGLEVSKRSLYRYVQDFKAKRDLDAEIIELMQQMPDTTIDDIASALGKGTSTIKRHIKAMKKGEKPRVKRVKKQWIVIDDE